MLLLQGHLDERIGLSVLEPLHSSDDETALMMGHWVGAAKNNNPLAQNNAPYNIQADGPYCCQKKKKSSDDDMYALMHLPPLGRL